MAISIVYFNLGGEEVVEQGFVMGAPFLDILQRHMLKVQNRGIELVASTNKRFPILAWDGLTIERDGIEERANGMFDSWEINRSP